MFRFKQFVVEDELCAMKVGTDGVLLGAWADVSDGCRLLDAGTGSGLIALMLAQRNTKAHITAIDIDSGAVCQARANVERASWYERISVECADMRTYLSDSLFDHIVTNPPYFVDSVPSPDMARTMARHTTSLSFTDIVNSAVRMLCNGGRLSVVLPTEQAAMFRREAFGRLWLTRLLDVSSREGELPKRTLMEFILSDAPVMPRVESLAIYSADGSYSDCYRQLTSDFYLKF